jgi:selenophosphate synthetase-related protein
VFVCPPENSARIIELFNDVGCAGAVVGKVDGGPKLTLRSGESEDVLFDFTKDIITGCGPYRK